MMISNCNPKKTKTGLRYQFGVQVPCTVAEALKLDKIRQN